MEVALAIQILTALPKIATGAVDLWNFVSKVRTASNQTGEWTAEAEAAFLQQLASRKDDPAYQPRG